MALLLLTLWNILILVAFPGFVGVSLSLANSEMPGSNGISLVGDAVAEAIVSTMKPKKSGYVKAWRVTYGYFYDLNHPQPCQRDVMRLHRCFGLGPSALQNSHHQRTD